MMQGYLTQGAVDRPSSADPVLTEPIGSLPIMFLHIPRTAGFTLKSMLESIFGTQRSLLDAHFYETSTKDIERMAVIEGHVRTAFFTRRVGRDWYTNGMTLLREPVARAVSQVRHTRARPDNRKHPLVASKVRDPDELFRRVPLWCNLETKMLSGRPTEGEMLDAAALDDAKATLDRLAFGLTEDFNVSIALFAERFGLDLPRYGTTNALPASGDEDLLSEEFRAAARDNNLLDARLYDHARELFARRVKAYVDTLLGLPLDESSLEAVLSSNGRRIDGALTVRQGADVADISGWILIDGHPPDAVLVRAGNATRPLCCRIFSPEAARLAHDASRRYAGVVGTVPLPRDVGSIELIAFDRTRGRRAQQRMGVKRSQRNDTAVETRSGGLSSLARRARRLGRGRDARASWG